MGCCTHRRKPVEGRPEQKWDYINLNDFKSKGCGTPFAYVYLWFMLIVSIAVYGVDTFTAINLLAFDRWSSAIQPAIDFQISKWIFSACIIASFVNLAFEQLRAMRVMKRGNIAECYLDNIAVRLESLRFGKGQGFKRFLVFAELTKSKKGAEYIALFTYFSFQSWIRVILCSGPRQVINALTLRSVYVAKLSSDGGSDVGQEILGFFDKIRQLAMEDQQQMVILSGMLFTLVIWIFSALFLLAAVLFYVLFLWHWIPRADGGLSAYCERKVNKSLTKIVHEKVEKAFAREEQKKLKAEAKEALKNGFEPPKLSRQATLPTLPDMGEPDKLPEMPQLDRKPTNASLPPYTSRPGTPGSIELGAMDRKRPMPSRRGTSTTTSSNSYAPEAPLASNSAEMGYSTPISLAGSLPSRRGDEYYGPPARSDTSHSLRNGPPPLHHASTFSSSSSTLHHNIMTESPATYSSETMPSFPPPVRSPTAPSLHSYGRAPSGQGRPGYVDSSQYPSDRASLAPSTFSDRSAAPRALRPGPPGSMRPGYQPRPPVRSATGPMPLGGPGIRPGPGPRHVPQRNMTAPMAPQEDDYFDFSDYFDGAGTPQGQQQPGPRGPGAHSYDRYDTDLESQRERRYY
ncbi:hypothetical protein SODALDRAFT_282187 [Sodiomyces alkalinus F11]|uniref:Pheromone-regulated membrane protein n=1 Tax=Sodiomyces alkalinus (strain CBS 110278 / VKM F-3762 / F11) TaxID=1314773 RepID=A0A3N2PQ59_SODAK|nr:hypothetical protein SODALDRAFT_282187 [Sodiomyces alkalinus F11]ROT36635.1 hypothetical protein SODALDRAFT_282187 [Sodiomyces alkalinus F11]